MASADTINDASPAISADMARLVACVCVRGLRSHNLVVGRRRAHLLQLHAHLDTPDVDVASGVGEQLDHPLLSHFSDLRVVQRGELPSQLVDLILLRRDDGGHLREQRDHLLT
ncbi:MAG: hypothetical protein KIT31_32965 [Deltaproteobacteria bacterium]|nr:hypothetical protein [Deltaproteobacteria bacterium]